MRARTLSRIVCRFPNLRYRRRCILSLHLTARVERRCEQFRWYDDDIAFSSRESLRWIRFADGAVVRAVAGEPFGDLPERFAFDAAADDGVPPSARRGRIVREERRHDLPLQLGTKKRKRNAHGLLNREIRRRFVERGDRFPFRGVAADAFGETRPRVAIMRFDDDVDFVIARERGAKLGGDLGGGCGEGYRRKYGYQAHPPLTHEHIVAADEESRLEILAKVVIPSVARNLALGGAKSTHFMRPSAPPDPSLTLGMTRS